jgi:hypothetical protein
MPPTQVCAPGRLPKRVRRGVPAPSSGSGRLSRASREPNSVSSSDDYQRLVAEAIATETPRPEPNAKVLHIRGRPRRLVAPPLRSQSTDRRGVNGQEAVKHRDELG